jgi:hypothetical protein
MHTPCFVTADTKRHYDRIDAEPFVGDELAAEQARAAESFDAQDLQDLLAECPESLFDAVATNRAELIGRVVLAARDAWINSLAMHNVFGDNVQVLHIKDAALAALQGCPR